MTTYLLSPDSLGLERVEPHVYANADMSAEERERLANLVATARERLTDFYGGVVSEPDILACSTDECFVGLGGTSQRGLSLGKSKILVSPRGLSASIVAHEWSHAELRARMRARMDGVFGVPSMPTWFDEGLAVAVSEEPAHSEAVWDEVVAADMPRPGLAELESLDDWNKAAREYGDVDFSKGVPGRLCVVYATAGHAVRQWRARVGKDGLLELIDRVRSGERFEAVYAGD